MAATLSAEQARMLRLFVAQMTKRFAALVRGELQQRQAKIDAALAAAHREKLENTYAKSER